MKLRWLAFGLVGIVGCGTGANGADGGDAADARSDVHRADAAADSSDGGLDAAVDATGTDAVDRTTDTSFDAREAGTDVLAPDVAPDVVDAASADTSDAVDTADAGDASDAVIADATDESQPDALDLDAAADAGDLDALDDATDSDATDSDASDSAAGDAGATTHVRILTGNLTTGNLQSYDPGQGIRIFQAMHPDIAVIQEFNYGTDSPADIRAMVDMAFGTEFVYTRGSGQIPNGVVSRYPMIASGTWTDASVTNRDFVWAHIDIPGPVDLWAISVHLLTSNSTVRNTEATAILAQINANIPPGDYVVLGGDFNTSTRTEPAITTLSSFFSTDAPWPADQNGNGNTNGPRTRPYDWVMTDAQLTPLRVPGVFGSSTYVDGLVFDTRVYTPLSEVPPALIGDSDPTNQMQHQAVVKDFEIPN